MLMCVCPFVVVNIMLAYAGLLYGLMFVLPLTTEIKLGKTETFRKGRGETITPVI